MLTTSALRESRFFVVFLACMVAMGPLSVDAYLPAIPGMANYFNTSIAAVNLTMSSFLIGNAIGQFFGGALSDQLGRKRIGLVGISIFILSTLLILRAETIETVQIYRLTQAIGSGFASVICLAQVRDLYPVDQVMRRFANVMFIMFLAPLLAPIVGALLVQFGWQTVFVFLGVWGVSVFIVYLFIVPETIKEKADRFSFKELFKGYLSVISHRLEGRLVASRFILFAAVSSAIFMTFLTNSALIYMQHFEVSEYQFALIFGGHGLMLMIGNRTAVKLSEKKLGIKLLRMMNLVQLLLTSTLVLLLLLNLHSLPLVLAFTLLIMGINGAINPTTAGLFIVHFEKHAGAAASLNTTAIFITGAFVGGTAALLSKGQILPIFILMMLCSLLARVILLTIRDSNA